MKLAAGIIIFNPEMQRLKDCLDSIAEQVERIYIFDNSTDKSIRVFESIINPLSFKIKYATEYANKGIAYALNKIMEMAQQEEIEWVVTLDQDSIMPKGIVDDYILYTKTIPKLGIVCPQVIDKRRSYMKIAEGPQIDYIKECITSASCTSVSAWEKVGKFDEWLIIDLVDNEFCKRLIASEYRILRLNKWILDQEFGKIIPKSKRKQCFWIHMSKILHNKNVAKLSYYKFVSPMRVYYTNRNIIYINRKLKLFGKTGYQNYNCNGYLGFLLSFTIPSLLRAQEKGQVLNAIIMGIKDGLKSKPAIWTFDRNKVI